MSALQFKVPRPPTVRRQTTICALARFDGAQRVNSYSGATCAPIRAWVERRGRALPRGLTWLLNDNTEAGMNTMNKNKAGGHNTPQGGNKSGSSGEDKQGQLNQKDQQNRQSGTSDSKQSTPRDADKAKR